MKTLYLLAGCNGAGKTTAAYALLPDLLDCREFVNADEIARGLSPFRPETVSIQAGRLMLGRVHELLAAGESFALATRIYLPIIEQAQARGYFVSLTFFWLNSADLAVERVQTRVREGGHNIAEPVIRRRYKGGLRQFFGAYRSAVNSWVFADNSTVPAKTIAKSADGVLIVKEEAVWARLTSLHHV